jgi:hypothetical protein
LGLLRLLPFVAAMGHAMTPQRIQLRRTKGWRKPEGAVVVSRPSKWGNPFIVHEHTDNCGEDLDDCPVWGNADVNLRPVSSREGAVISFRHCYQFPLSDDPYVPDVDEIRSELAGRDLACWCPLDQPCHADVLLKIASGGTP